MRTRILFVTLFTLLFVQHVSTQDTCAPITQAVIEELGTICSSLSRNTACYGNNLVRAEFSEQQPVTAFTQPADTVPVAMIDALRTSPLNADRDEWGIAVMNIQANIPDTLPGQGVIFLVMGGGEISNAPETRTDAAPMQAFYFRTGIGAAECNEAPATVAIQSPENIQINLTINGVDISIGSTIFFIDNGNNTITAIVEEGTMILTLDGTVIVTDEAIDFTVDNTGLIGTWTAPRPATPDEMVIGDQINQFFVALNNPEAPVQVETTSGKYVVQPGDNLFRIALNNNTCVSAIVNANNISESQIRNIPVGLELTIPDNSTCGEFVNDVTNTTSIIPIDAEEGDEPLVDCSSLQVTSPLDGLAASDSTFYWNGIPEATEYRVTLYKDDVPALVDSTPAPNTSLTMNLSVIPTGIGIYFWDVVAIVNGTPVCRSQSGSMERQWGEPKVHDPDDDNDQGCDTAGLSSSAASACSGPPSYGSYTIDPSACTFTCY